MNTHRERQIIAIIAGELNREPESIALDNDFIDDLHADSIDTANILNSVKISFKVVIPMTDAENIITVKDLVDYIAKAKGEYESN